MRIAFGNSSSEPSRIIQIGGGEPKIYEEYQNDLINDDAQAARFGLQKIFSFYYGYRQATINAQFEDVMDGEIASIDARVMSEGQKRYRVRNVTINFSSDPKKVRINVETEGDYSPYG
jgi:hypothetical protein